MAAGGGDVLRRRSANAALGPLLVTTTEDYAAVGGHGDEAVRREVIEDMALGRRYARAGLGVTVVLGAADVGFRM